MVLSWSSLRFRHFCDCGFRLVYRVTDVNNIVLKIEFDLHDKEFLQYYDYGFDSNKDII